MKALLYKFWDRLRSSFWFIPALMVAAATVLAYVIVAVDAQVVAWLHRWLGWTFTGGAEGASAVLGTIAGSMITIAGLVFSMTLVALSLASSQLGPRLLRHFMRDTATQVVLGTFVSGFLYCVLVLRTVRRADEAAFVPHTAVSLGVLMAVLGVVVLIYFIHHVSVSIQTNEVVARVGDDLTADIDRLYPEPIAPPEQAHAPKSEPPSGAAAADGQAAPPKPCPAAPDPRLLLQFEQAGRAVLAHDDGYVQYIDHDALLDLACAHNLVLQLALGPGHYVVAGRPLLTVLPADGHSAALARKVNGLFALGGQRSSGQDIGYAVEQLVEVAVRALSPGVNDPFTAIACIDRLVSALSRLARRREPLACRCDSQGQLRTISLVVTFADVVDTAFNQIRQNSSNSAAVSIRLIDGLAELATAVTRATDRAALLRQVAMVAEVVPQALPALPDRLAVLARCAAARQRVQAGFGGQALAAALPAGISRP